MTFEELKAELIKAGIVPKCEALCYTRYFKFIDDLPVDVQTFAMDCFTPDGKPIEPGYEESLDTYWFHINSWEELQRDWELFCPVPVPKPQESLSNHLVRWFTP